MSGIFGPCLEAEAGCRPLGVAASDEQTLEVVPAFTRAGEPSTASVRRAGERLPRGAAPPDGSAAGERLAISSTSVAASTTRPTSPESEPLRLPRMPSAVASPNARASPSRRRATPGCSTGRRRRRGGPAKRKRRFMHWDIACPRVLGVRGWRSHSCGHDTTGFRSRKAFPAYSTATDARKGQLRPQWRMTVRSLRQGGKQTRLAGANVRWVPAVRRDAGAYTPGGRRGSRRGRRARRAGRGARPRSERRGPGEGAAAASAQARAAATNPPTAPSFGPALPPNRPTRNPPESAAIRTPRAGARSSASCRERGTAVRASAGAGDAELGLVGDPRAELRRDRRERQPDEERRRPLDPGPCHGGRCSASRGSSEARPACTRGRRRFLSGALTELGLRQRLRASSCSRRSRRCSWMRPPYARGTRGSLAKV